MSGHSHWAGIKHQKGAADAKRGQIFSKLLVAITAAARTEPNPAFNPRLRTAIQKAKENKVPAENIERAIQRAASAGEAVEEVLLEAYGPGGAALLIEAVTGNRNRTIPEVKKVLSDHGGKWAETGSVLWAFTKQPATDENEGEKEAGWRAKFPQEFSPEEKRRLAELTAALAAHADVQRIHTNALPDKF